jgi:hypothetical protein
MPDYQMAYPLLTAPDAPETALPHRSGELSKGAAITDQRHRKPLGNRVFSHLM